MDKIDWKRKLTSRKFWAAVCTFVTNLIIMFGGTEDTTVKVVATIMASAGLIAYIIGEGLVDAANTEEIVVSIPDEEAPPDKEN